MKRALSLSLAMALMAGTLTGCGGQTETKETTAKSEVETKTEATTTAGAGSSENVETEASYLCAEDPITLTFFNIFDNITFDPSWQVFQEAAKLTNVSLESSVSKSSSDEVAAFNLMISSGKLADLISYKSLSELEKLGMDGALLPLNDLIAEHAPNLQKAMDENPDLKKIATAVDGNIYVIPKIQTVAVAEGDFIRMDWLEKLDLEVPNTVDELYEVFTAFRNEDPNGNGIKDEIPMLSRQGNKHFDDVLNLWDAHQDFYVRDGKITFGPMEEEFHLAMTNAIKWYEEGLIDPEYFTRGSNSRDVLLGADQGGYCNDWFGSNAEYNDKLADTIHGFSFMPIAPVENQKGNRVAHTSRVGNPGWAISATCEDPVAAIKYMDFWFTEVGSKLVNFGIEGVTYTEENGEITYTDAIMKSDKTALSELRGYGVQYRIGMIQDYAYEEAWSNEIAAAGNAMYEENGYVYTPIPELNGELALKYVEEDANEYKKIMAGITPYVAEMIQKWVLGSADFESTYPKFIESLKDKGIERAIEINQIAYDVYMSN